MFKRWMLCALILLGAADCGSRHRTADPAQAQAAQKKKFGEDCSGRDPCESGVCVANGSGKLSCSKECQNDGDCGTGWRCNQLFGSPHGQLCVAVR